MQVRTIPSLPAHRVLLSVTACPPPKPGYYTEVEGEKGIPDYFLRSPKARQRKERTALKRPMPIYEFYCSDCHRIYRFLSRRPDVTKRPACPRCARPELERQISLFAVSRRVGGSSDEELPEPEIDEASLERAMETLGREAESLDEDDPRQAARLMRELYGATGLKLGPAMEEAIRRMESGEDPDTLEEELGDALEKEDPFSGAGIKNFRSLSKRLTRPAVDDNLYDL